MKGDFSRLTFDPKRHYTGVLHQQGRVWLDTDWNDDVLNRLSLVEQETADIIGLCGVPIAGQCADPAGGDSAFRIVPIPGTAANFTIDAPPDPPGRFYVDGILCRIEGPVQYDRQDDFPDAPPLPGLGRALVYLEVWQRLITYLEDPGLREIALNGPDTATRLKTIVQVKCLPLPPGPLPTDFTCSAAAKFLPVPGQGTLSTNPPVDTLPADECRLPEAANYTGRENHLYRVEIHNPGDVFGGALTPAFQASLVGGAGLGDAKVTLATPLTAAQRAAVLARGTLTLADERGYSELLRVNAVDAGGTTLTLTEGLSADYPAADHPVVSSAAWFKWSRDNAAIAFSVTGVASENGQRVVLTLGSLGRDLASSLRAGDLVEISDDASDLGPARGHLTYLAADPDPDLLTVKIAQPLPARFHDPGALMAGSPPEPGDRHLTIRRWDGAGWASAQFDAAATPDMDFGEGVHVHFGGSDLRAGDFWQFTARSTDGSVQSLQDAPPVGIIRHTCPLAVIQLDANDIKVLHDCRELFPPLTRLTGLFYVSGDGQEVRPNLTTLGPAQFLPLAEQLCVRVQNGSCPVQPATVRFTVLAGGGRLRAGAASSPNHVDVTTVPTGLACCNWDLGGNAPLQKHQRVEARLLDPDGLPTAQVVIFNANLSVADEVAYDPGACHNLQGATDVQAAIDRLASVTNLVYLGGDGQTALPDPTNLARFLTLDQPLRAGVFNDCGPLPDGTIVTFRPSGQGRVARHGGPLGAAGAAVDVPTANGVAECDWQLDPDHGQPSQTVVATIAAGSVPESVTEIHFTASMLRAQDVVYDPPQDCPNLAGAQTVKAALDALCSIQGGGRGCEVTVGEGGEFPTLEQALQALQSRALTTWCICLLPGKHSVEQELVIASTPPEPPLDVSITACSQGVQLVLRAPLTAQNLSSFRLAGMSVLAENLVPVMRFTGCTSVNLAELEMQVRNVDGRAINFEGCQTVTIREVTAVAASMDALMTFKDSARLTVANCRLELDKSQLLLDFENGTERVLIEDNVLAVHTGEITPSPERVLGDFPEVVDLLKVRADDEFMAKARDIAARFASMPAADRKQITDRLSARLTQLRPELNRSEVEGYNSLVEGLRADPTTPEMLVGILVRMRPAVGLPGVAIVISDPRGDATLRSNVISGLVSLYGFPGDPLTSVQALAKVSQRLRDGLPVQPAPGTFYAEGNRLTRFVIAAQIVAMLRDLAAGTGNQQDFSGIYQAMLLTDNVIEAEAGRASELVAARLSLASTVFAENASPLAIAVVQGPTIVGNHGPNPQSQLLVCSAIPPTNLATLTAANLFMLVLPI